MVKSDGFFLKTIFDCGETGFVTDVNQAAKLPGSRKEKWVVPGLWPPCWAFCLSLNSRVEEGERDKLNADEPVTFLERTKDFTRLRH